MHLIKAIFKLHCVQFYWIYCHYSAKNDTKGVFRVSHRKQWGGQGKVSIEGRSQGSSAVGPSPGGITTELYANVRATTWYRSVLGNKKNTAYTMNLQRKCDKIFKIASYYKEQIFRWSRGAVIAHIALDTLGTKHSQSQGWRVICIQTTTWPHPTNLSHWTIQKKSKKE